MEKRAVIDVAGPWVEPDLDSSLIQRCRDNWKTPLCEVSNYVLATFIRQQIALRLVVPEAQRRIALGFTDETEVIEDELALAIAGISPSEAPR